MRKIELLLHSEKKPYLKTETHQLWPDAGDNQTTNCRIEGPQIVQKVRGRRRAESDNGQDGTPRAIGWRGLPRHWCATNCNCPLISCLLCRWSAVYCVDHLGPLLRPCRCLSESRPQCSRCLHLSRLGWPDDTEMNSSVKAWSWHAITTLSKDWLRW